MTNVRRLGPLLSFATSTCESRLSSRLPRNILKAWAGTGTGAAASAWVLAKSSFASDGDADTWMEPGFVKSAFSGMAAIPGEHWWNELASLSGTVQVHAVFGAAEFASNGQVITDFTSWMEDRVLDSGSHSVAAAFYAAGGHTTAAKDHLEAVTEVDEWHTIAREVARQQAEFEPGKALQWLESQFAQPSDAIADAVNSVGLMHDLNAQDLLLWLEHLPDSVERVAGIKRIHAAFPQLRPELAIQDITLE